MPKKPTLIALKDLRIDGDTQPRVELDQSLIDEYADLYTSGVDLPPLDVYFDGADHWLVDGFHRRWGAKKANLDAMPCIVTEGTVEEARWASYAANKSHGLRRTNDDKRKAVLASLKHPSGSSLSDAAIALHVGVSDRMVAKYRAESTPKVSESAPRTGRDGRTINTANIGKGKPDPAHLRSLAPDVQRAIEGKEIRASKEEVAALAALNDFGPQRKAVKAVQSGEAKSIKEALAPKEPETKAAAPEPPDPDSLEAVQADLRDLEKAIRDVARQARDVLGCKGNEITRPWCGCYSLLSITHPLQSVARTILNDLPVGGTAENPKLAREEAAEKV